MVNVTKQEVRMEESLRKRLEFICEFCRVKPIIINGNLRIIIINDITFLAFNYSNEIFIENLNNKIKLSELEDYLKHNVLDDDDIEDLDLKKSKDDFER